MKTQNATPGDFTVRGWEPYPKNTLRAFVSLELPSGMILHDCTLHQMGDSRWFSMPAKQYTKGGTQTWTPIIEFTSKEVRADFQARAIAAIDAYPAEVAHDLD